MIKPALIIVRNHFLWLIKFDFGILSLKNQKCAIFDRRPAQSNGWCNQTANAINRPAKIRQTIKRPAQSNGRRNQTAGQTIKAGQKEKPLRTQCLQGFELFPNSKSDNRNYLFENCEAFLAFLSPYFFLSFILESLVKNPAAFRGAL